MLDGVELGMASTAEQLRSIQKFGDLIHFLEDELDWPLQRLGLDDLTFEYSPEDLGLRKEDAAQIKAINQLRPLASNQPWGIFFIAFERKKLPIVVLRRVLSHLVIKKRASANSAERARWNTEDILFISAFGEEETEQREIAFAHFHQDSGDLPTLKVLGWDGGDTTLKLEYVSKVLKERLRWPDDISDREAWRRRWSAAFQHRVGHVIRTADGLAESLAAFARSIRDAAKTLMGAETERGPLRKLHKAFQTALIHDLTEEGFADTYAQTITYGLLTAAISRTEMSEGRHGTALIAENVADIVPITNPFLKEMLQSFLKVGGRKGGIDFDELGVQDVVELLRGEETDLPAILRDFGNKNRGQDPVIHFYEHFLRAYNKKLKVQRGVFYTPQPVVSYIVRSVHELLQTEFGLEDGLASTITWSEMAAKHSTVKIPDGTQPTEPFVVTLDPATGTATFLVEVIDVINKTMVAKWQRQGLNAVQQQDAWDEYVPKHLLPRLYGYELMMAPYAIAHMKIGLKLFETGYRFGSEERVRIYLTNALEPASDDKKQREFEEWAPALAHEALAVNNVKRRQRFTVVIGNPPYSLMSANLKQEHRKLIEPYRFVDGHKIKERGALQLEKNLQDDYVKFIRLGQMICDVVTSGVLALVTNHAYLDNPTLRGLRNSLLATFDEVFVLDLHGNAKRKEACPLSEGDKNVFDIQQGVAIGVFVRHSTNSRSIRMWGELWGSRDRKYSALLGTSALKAAIHPFPVVPPLYLFIAQDDPLRGEFDAGLAIDEIFDHYSTGIATARDGLTIHFSNEALSSVLDRLSQLEPEEAREQFSLGPDTNDWKVALAQADLLRTGYAPERISRILYRPFDSRWTYYTGQPRGFHCNPRRPVMQHLLSGQNLGLCASKAIETGHEFSHVFVTNSLADHHCVSLKEVNYILPLFVYSVEGESSTRNFDFGQTQKIRQSNLSTRLSQALEATLGMRINEAGEGTDTIASEDVFYLIYSILFAPSYRLRYASFLRKEFARISLPRSRELLRKMADIGSELVALHLLKSHLLNLSITTYSGPLNLAVEKVSRTGDTVWLDLAKTRGFHNVPECVWQFHVGGYRVCEKWLRDRKGQTLSENDIGHYHKIVVALNETVRLMKEIDELIEQYGGWPGAFADNPKAGTMSIILSGEK
jgi:hypothetical protein